MTIVNTGTGLVRPLAVVPTTAGNVVTPTSFVPSPLAINAAINPGADAASFAQWWTAVSQLNGSRPGTPLQPLSVAPFPRMASPTLEQMQVHLQQVQQVQQVEQFAAQQQAAAAAGFKKAQGHKQSKRGEGKASAGQRGDAGAARGAQAANGKGADGANGTAAGGAQGPNGANPNLPLKASRHKYAEQRRRNRINERLDHLRTLVPHTEGSNIAGFLDQLIVYVTDLQTKMGLKPQGSPSDEKQQPAKDEEAAAEAAKGEAKVKAPAGTEATETAAAAEVASVGRKRGKSDDAAAAKDEAKRAKTDS
mmetsp:Transcript_35301/g.76623  ORF Transcript_35301/g.76623 Transcript_35301/m.76623 type:complete len:307 (-) Transcript_35301:259-1179(-)